MAIGTHLDERCLRLMSREQLKCGLVPLLYIHLAYFGLSDDCNSKSAPV